MQKQKRGFLGVIQGMFVGVAKPDEYIENGKASWGWALLLSVLVSFVVTFLTVYIPINNVIGKGKLEKTIDEAVVDFSLTNDGFFCDEKYEWKDESDGTYLYVDTTKRLIDQDVIDESNDHTTYKSVVIISSEEIYMYSVSDGEQKFKWSDLYTYLKTVDNKTVYDKSMILDIVDNYVGPVLFLSLAGGTVIAFIGFLLAALIWALIGKIGTAIWNLKIPYGTLVKAAIYIRIIWYTVRKLLAHYVLPNSFKGEWTLGLLIILAYVLLAVFFYSRKYPNEGIDNGFKATPGAMYYGNQQLNPQQLYGNAPQMYGNGSQPVVPPMNDPSQGIPQMPQNPGMDTMTYNMNPETQNDYNQNM